jgi:hypothetical protein
VEIQIPGSKISIFSTRTFSNYTYETLYVGQKINRSKGESKEKALLVNQKQTLATQKKRKHTAAGGSHTKGKYEPFGKEVKTD